MIPKLAEHRATETLALIHSDLHEMPPSRSGIFRYFITFIDEATRLWVVIRLKAKSDAFAAFKQFKAYAENQTGAKIKALHDDKGGEYMSREFDAYLAAAGILRQHTVRAKPHQNGVAERANRTIVEGITAMLNKAHLPASFWVYALSALVHVRNRSPTSALLRSTPYKRWYHRKPDVSHLRVFGCTPYVHVQKDQRKGLQSHTKKCLFVGYPPDYKGWVFWDLENKRELISNNAEFDERAFPGTTRQPVDFGLPPPEPSIVTIPMLDAEPQDQGGARQNIPAPQPPHPAPVPGQAPAPAPAQNLPEHPVV